MIAGEGPSRVGRRVVAWLIDGLVMSPLAIVPISIQGHGVDQGRAGLAAAVALLITLSYLVAFDAFGRGATPGKRIVGIRVADAATGMTIGVARACLRRVVYFVGGLLFFAGWLWALLDAEHRAWHDMAARTLVIASH